MIHGEGPGFEKLWFDRLGRHFMTADAAGHLSYRKFNDVHELIEEIDPNGNANAAVWSPESLRRREALLPQIDAYLAATRGKA